jgi:protein-tyrosine kinase
MSKIYEALELAKRHLRRSAASPGPSSLPFQLNMEQEMMELCQVIHSADQEKETSLIEFIGSNPGEGTSTVAREFAKALSAKFSRKVLLMDADCAHPTQGRAFGLMIEKDLQKIIERGLSATEACYRVPGSTLSVCYMAESLSFISTLCQLEEFDYIWKEFREKYDTVIVDSPPGNTSSVGFDLGRKVDRVVLIVEAEKTRWPVAVNVKEKIVNNGGEILGIIFNKRKFYIPGWIYKRL